MPNKIQDSVKASASFAYAKSVACNSREAARFFSFFADDADFNSTTHIVKSILVSASREPKVNTHQFEYVLTKNGVCTPTRSKLVMEYQRQTRMLENIRKLREANKKLCDSILESIDTAEAELASDKRAYILDILSQRVNP
jgi:hypothetical protein